MQNISKSYVTEPSGRPLNVWELLSVVHEYRETIEWLLDVAAANADDGEEAAVEEVRWFLRKRMAGITASLDVRHLVIVLDLLNLSWESELGATKVRDASFAAPRTPTDGLPVGALLAALIRAQSRMDREPEIHETATAKDSVPLGADLLSILLRAKARLELEREARKDSAPTKTTHQPGSTERHDS